MGGRASPQQSAASLLPIALLVVLGLSWGLHFPILKFAARSGLPYSGINFMHATSGLIGTVDADIIVSLKENHHPTTDYVRRLRTDPATIESVARGELGLVKPGEILVTIKDVK